MGAPGHPGRYEVELAVAARKLRADGQGRETEIRLDDQVDIGIVTRKKVDGQDREKELYLNKHHLVENATTLKVGVAPFHKLIDRNPEDNRKKVKAVE